MHILRMLDGDVLSRDIRREGLTVGMLKDGGQRATSDLKNALGSYTAARLHRKDLY